MSDMRTVKDKSTWVMTGILLTLSLITLLAISPWITSTYESVDVNTGDIRRQVYVCHLQIRDKVRVTPFSQEVRRLDLCTHETPHWEVMHQRVYQKRASSNEYHVAIEGCNILRRYFDLLALPDESRKSILQEALQHLQMRQSAEIEQQCTLLLDRYLAERGKPGDTP